PYGAGGTSRRLTTELSSRIKAETGIETMAHLTCAGHTEPELRRVVCDLHEAGIENIMAIRGDPPLGGGDFIPTPGGLRYGSELIALVQDVARADGFELCIGAAAYPEGHPESADRQADLSRLLNKVEAGATFFITQL